MQRAATGSAMAKEWRRKVRPYIFFRRKKKYSDKTKKWGSMSLKEEKNQLEMKANVKLVFEQPEKRLFS